MAWDTPVDRPAFGNPMLTRQGIRGGAVQVDNQTPAETARLSRQNAAAAASRPSPSAGNPTQAATKSENKPPIAPTKGPSADRGVHYYPPELRNFPYFLALAFGPYDRNVAFNDALVDHDLFVYLPVPANLTESFGTSYNKASLGPFGGEFAGAISTMANDIGSGKDLKKSITDALTNGVRRANNDSTLMPVFISQAVKGSEALGTGVNMMFGLTPNPNLAVSFQGVPLRSYGFSWKLAPQSKEESQELIKMFTKLKQRMLPYKDGFALRYPDYVDVSIGGESSVLKDLIKFKTSVLTDMKVNYAPSGVPSFFAGTQVPTEMELSLSFQEVKVFTRSDFSNIPTI